MAGNPLTGFTHRRRRGAELFLIVLSLVVGIGAYAAVGLGVEGSIPTNIIGYGGWLAVLVIVCHVVVRMTAPYADPVLLPVVAALNGLGLAMIYRIDLAELAQNEDANTFASDQLIWMTLGVLLFVAVLFLLKDHRRLQAFTYTSGLAAIVLLLLPLVPVLGTEINGARIWINLGPMSFQPGEVAKVLLVVAFAGYLVLHRDAHGPFRTRRALKEVARLGPKAFEQCAGFLRIPGGDDPLYQQYHDDDWGRRVTDERELFEKHVELACATDKPLMIHGRPAKGTMDAYEDLIEIRQLADGLLQAMVSVIDEQERHFVWAGEHF